MMDVSDGLAKDLESLTPAGLVPALDAAAIPISQAARRQAKRSGQSPLHHALGDGEDYELLIVIRSQADLGRLQRDWQKRFPSVPMARLGHFVAQGKLPTGALHLSDYRGYEHLR